MQTIILLLSNALHMIQKLPHISKETKNDIMVRITSVMNILQEEDERTSEK